MNGAVRPPRRWFDAYVFDLDGTIWLGKRLLPGVGTLLATLERRGIPAAFVSNNTTSSAAGYEWRLRRLGIPARRGSVITPAGPLCRHLRERGVGCAHVIGEAPLRRALRSAGIAIAREPEEAECVVAGFDRTLTYRKLLVAHRALERGALYVATNPDRVCPMPDGPWPDAAAVVGALEATTGRRPDAMVGKPSVGMVAAAAEWLRVARARHPRDDDELGACG